MLLDPVKEIHTAKTVIICAMMYIEIYVGRSRSPVLEAKPLDVPSLYPVTFQAAPWRSLQAWLFLPLAVGKLSLSYLKASRCSDSIFFVPLTGYFLL